MASERFALVAGSSGGLGYEVCQLLLDQGLSVFGVSRSVTDIEDPNFIQIQADLRDEESIEIIQQVLEEDVFGLEVVVNASGFFDAASVDEMESETLIDHLQTNVVGAFHLLRATQDYLLEGESHIVHISSMAALKGLPHFSAYCASKAALEKLIESTRQEWKESGVKFSTLVCSEVDTALWDDLTDQSLKPDSDNMLEVSDFIYVLSFVLNAPRSIEFSKVEFSHKNSGH